MVSKRKKRGQKRNPRATAGRAAASSRDSTPASEVVIEGRADGANPGKQGHGRRNPFSSKRPGRDRFRDAADSIRSAWDTHGLQTMTPGLWAAGGVALVVALVIAYGLLDARHTGQENAALLQRIEAVEGELSRIKSEDPAEAIAAFADRVEKLERDISGLEAEMEENFAAMLEDVSSLASQADAGAAAIDARLLDRLDRLERNLDRTRVRLEETQSEPSQPEEAGTEQPDDSTPWWGFLGRALKISRIDGE